MGAQTDGPVLVEGLRDLQRELRAIDGAWPRELRAANKAAADLVAEGTRASFLSRGGSAPMVANTVKALAQQRSASVKIGGGNSVGGQVAMGNEFGGRGRPTTQQFPSFKRGGYSLFPTVKEKREEVIAAYDKAIDRLLEKAFPD